MIDLACALTQYRIINYVGDTNIHCSNKNSDLENTTTWFIQNGMKPNLEKYQAMVLGRTEDQLLLKSSNIDIRTKERLTNQWELSWRRMAGHH